MLTTEEKTSETKTVTKCQTVGPIVQFRLFDEDYYNSSYQRLVFGTKKLVITTADLVSTLHKIQSNFDTEINSKSWRTLTCLGILAKEELIDLSIHYRVSEGQAIVNVTPTENPYWSVATIEKGYINQITVPVVAQTNESISIKYFARPIEYAEAKLLEKAENDWFKQWYSQEPMTYEDWKEVTKDLDFPRQSITHYPGTANIISECCFVLN